MFPLARPRAATRPGPQLKGPEHNRPPPVEYHFRTMQRRQAAELQKWPLNGHLLLVRSGSLPGNSVDLCLGSRIVPQKAAEIRGMQYEHPAIPERHHIGPAPLAAEQRHLAKKVAAAHSRPTVWQHHLASNRADHK